MKKTVWTMAATGLFATFMTGCGAKDYSTAICNRLQTCNALYGTTVSQCVATENQTLSVLATSQRPAADQAIDQCLATSSCAGFDSCVNTAISQESSGVNTSTASTDPIAAICSRLQSCGALSLADGSSNVDDCTTGAGDLLSALTSHQQAAAAQAAEHCLAFPDCGGFASCANTLISQVSNPPPSNPASTPNLVEGICNRLQACGGLSDATEVSDCVASGNQSLSSMNSSQLATLTQMVGQCLALSDCASFESCFESLQTSGASTTTPSNTSASGGSAQVGTYVTSTCNRLQSCGALSMIGASTVSQCAATVNQALGSLPSSALGTYNQMLNQCLAVSSCASFESCLTSTSL
jgi:hypothetical protein